MIELTAPTSFMDPMGHGKEQRVGLRPSRSSSTPTRRSRQLTAGTRTSTCSNAMNPRDIKINTSMTVLRERFAINESSRKNLTLASGLEEDTDQIVSTNLGQHGRNRGAGYAAVEWLRPAHGSLSLGAREEVFDGGRSVFSPMISATRWLSQKTTLHASIGHGFRIPTYLDLYYSDPSTLGNPNLKPESAWNFDAGVSWFPKPQVAATDYGLLLAAARHDRLHARLRGRPLAGEQSSRCTVQGRGGVRHLAAAVDGTLHSQLDQSCRNAKCAPRPPVRIRLQLPHQQCSS